jgi:hypothetical protein
MADLITDPSFLSQGNTVSWNTSNPGQPAKNLKFTNSGPNVGSIANGDTATTLPSFDIDDHFEIRGATSANNNGLYKVTAVTADTQDYVVAKLAGSQGSMETVALDTTPFILGSDAIAGNTTPGTTPQPTATGKSVYYDTYSRKIWLIRQGNLGDEGVTLQSLYSFTKEEWKNDPYLIQFDFPFDAITPEQFEFTNGWRFYDNAIAANTAEISSGDRLTRDLVRTGGWSEFNENNTAELIQQYTGVITLGTFEDETEDRAYVQFGDNPRDTTARDPFVFFGPVNEAIRTYDIAVSNTNATSFVFTGNTIQRTSGNWLTDNFNVGGKLQVITANTVGNQQTSSVLITNITQTTNPSDTISVAGTGVYTPEALDTQARIAYDNRNAVSLFLRGNSAPSTTSLSKAYDSSDLAGIGVSTTTNQVYRFPLTNSLDPKITVVDPTVSVTAAGEEYANVEIRYFPSAFSLQVDSSTLGQERQFGIVIDGGTHSSYDGSVTATGTTLTSAEGGINEFGSTYFNNGKLIVQNGTVGNKNLVGYDITSHTDTTVTISGIDDNEFTDTESSLSFSLIPATKIFNGTGPTIEEIYNRVQYQLRQAANINDFPGGGVVAGDTADELLTFVGDAITGGSVASPPENPEGGGTGVCIVGFDINDTNDISFVTNTGESKGFPFLASGTLVFNDTLKVDTEGYYWMFYDHTHRRTTTATLGSISGSQATITVSSGDATSDFTRVAPGANGPTDAQLQEGDYIRISGFANEVNNGIWRILTYTDAQNMVIQKSDGDTAIAETSVSNVLVDENPIDSPSAIIVEDNGGSQIRGSITVNSVPFDYDYTNNNQGKRIPSSNSLYGGAEGAGNVPIILIRAIGLDDSQFIEVLSSIPKAAGTNIPVNGGQERNYSNP